jgi:hypothetical protein
MAPDSRGYALKAAIVPDETVDGAIREIVRLRRKASFWDRVLTRFGL